MFFDWATAVLILALLAPFTALLTRGLTGWGRPVTVSLVGTSDAREIGSMVTLGDIVHYGKNNQLAAVVGLHGKNVAIRPVEYGEPAFLADPASLRIATGEITIPVRFIRAGDQYRAPGLAAGWDALENATMNPRDGIVAVVVRYEPDRGIGERVWSHRHSLVTVTRPATS